MLNSVCLERHRILRWVMHFGCVMETITMRPMRLFNKTFSLFIVTLFVVSFSLAGNSAAIPQTYTETSAETSYLTNPSPVSYSIPAAEGTNVDWYTDVGLSLIHI